MPDNARLEELIAAKQEQFQIAAQTGSFDELEEINDDINDLMMALYY